MLLTLSTLPEFQTWAGVGGACASQTPSLNLSPVPSYPCTSGRPHGASVRNICSSISPGHTQGSLLNSGSCGPLHHISNVASRGNKLLVSPSSITVQEPGKEGREAWAVLSPSQALPGPIPLVPLPLASKTFLLYHLLLVLSTSHSCS